MGHAQGPIVQPVPGAIEQLGMLLIGFGLLFAGPDKSPVPAILICSSLIIGVVREIERQRRKRGL